MPSTSLVALRPTGRRWPGPPFRRQSPPEEIGRLHHTPICEIAEKCQLMLTFWSGPLLPALRLVVCGGATAVLFFAELVGPRKIVAQAPWAGVGLPGPWRPVQGLDQSWTQPPLAWQCDGLRRQRCTCVFLITPGDRCRAMGTAAAQTLGPRVVPCRAGAHSSSGDRSRV